MDANREQRSATEYLVAMGIAVGAGIGILFGLMLGNPAIWVAVGAGLGLVAGAAVQGLRTGPTA